METQRGAFQTPHSPTFLTLPNYFSQPLPTPPHNQAKRDYDYLFKLVLIGDTGVGKSCLLLRFADDGALRGPRGAKLTLCSAPNLPDGGPSCP